MSARIAVVGSGLTRSALAEDPRFYVPAGHFLARVSMAGLATPPVLDADLSAVATDFRRELVRRDLTRTLVADLVQLQPDLIVIDLVDERFPLDVLPSGAVVTASPEYLESNPPADGRRRVVGGSEEHLELWTRGWERFLSAVDAVGLSDRLVFHHGGMATRSEDGVPVPGEEKIALAAHLAERLGDRAALDLEPSRVLRVDDAIRRARTREDGSADPLMLAPAAADALARGVAAVLEGRDPLEVEGLVPGILVDVVAKLPAGPENDPAGESRAQERACGDGAPGVKDGSVAAEPSILQDDSSQRRVVPSDYANYGVETVEWGTAEGFQASDFGPGIHVLPLLDGNHLDVIIRGDLRSVAKHESVVVFLTGAMSQRNSVAPPFFAGRRLSHELGIPWVAVSDPSMQLSEQVLLTWYTGAPGSAAHSTLVAALRSMADTLDRDLLLVGGSGGGFAALRLNEELEGRTSVFAWNPQSEILDYHPPAVREYLHTLFPGEHLDPETDRSAVEARLAEAGIVHRVETLEAGRRVLVFQNAGDHHVERHLLPLVRRTHGMTGGPRHYASDEDHLVRIASWGSGHAVLPAHLTARAVDALRRGHSVRTVAEDIIGMIWQERGEVPYGPEIMVTTEPGGRARVDWAAVPVEKGGPAAYSLSRMRGDVVVDSVGHIYAPVIVSRLADGEHWCLESWDSRGRLVDEVHFDGRGDPLR